MSYSYLIVGSVEILGTTMLKGPLRLGFPATELLSHTKLQSSEPSPRIVPAHFFRLVVCMAAPQVGRLPFQTVRAVGAEAARRGTVVCPGRGRVVQKKHESRSRRR